MPPKKYPKHLPQRVPPNSNANSCSALSSKTIQSFKKTKETECSSDGIQSIVNKNRKMMLIKPRLEYDVDEEKLQEIKAREDFEKDRIRRQKAFDASIDRILQLKPYNKKNRLDD